MKKIVLILFIALISFEKTEAQVNVGDSLALVDLYNSTDGAHWGSSDFRWTLTDPVNTWYGVTVSANRVTGLSLEVVNLAGPLPSSLGNLTGLTNLDLAQNGITGSIPFSIGNLVNLTNLQLDNNQISGNIPSSIGNLTKLITLDLSEDNLSGNIPASMGKLINLQTLELGSNQLSSSIPSTLGNLSNIVTLDLSYNHLSGTIPSSLDHFTHIGSIVGSIGLFLNQFTFAGMQGMQKAYESRVDYHIQALIPLHYNAGTFSVSVGGTLSKETFYWYKNGTLVAKIVGDSTFKSQGIGKYNVNVRNKILTPLTLYSVTDTLRHQGFTAGISANKISYSAILYPNPAKDILNITISSSQNEIAQIEIIDVQGKVVSLINKNIVSGANAATINVSALVRGNYFVRIKTLEGETSEKFVKE